MHDIKVVQSYITSIVAAVLTKDKNCLGHELGAAMSVWNDTYGIKRIPTMVAGAQGCEKSRISNQHEDRLPRFGPRGCVKP